MLLSRFVDYYRVARGRPTSEGKHLRRGVHVVSHDRDARPKPVSQTRRAPPIALGYDGGHNSDSTNTDHNKPPRPNSRSR